MPRLTYLDVSLMLVTCQLHEFVIAVDETCRMQPTSITAKKRTHAKRAGSTAPKKKGQPSCTLPPILIGIPPGVFRLIAFSSKACEVDGKSNCTAAGVKREPSIEGRCSARAQGAPTGARRRGPEGSKPLFGRAPGGLAVRLGAACRGRDHSGRRTWPVSCPLRRRRLPLYPLVEDVLG